MATPKSNRTDTGTNRSPEKRETVRDQQDGKSQKRTEPIADEEAD
ncbi:hypothetical protein [Pacificimonas flava]|uniref:Uncharacterized protein n=1 Tax=Pacificimonas flava TaxID=1234595 RepID=M2TNG9_9SPHN|nr:hypothetical protein [Pacificimonas flava]EMD83271.1 hypothetical protein C725_1172 [Pacificimonas flava]MBB5279168.1 hypothetical protein [Pacificimonas flava]